MAATLIQSTSNASGLSLTFTGVQVGDAIIVAGMGFFNTGPGGACNDTVGNVYEGPFFSSGGGFGIVNGYYTISQFAGTITVSMLTAGTASIGALYRNPGGFDQSMNLLGYYTPSDPSYPIGVGTGPCTLADTLMVTLVGAPGIGFYDASTIISDSGDSLVNFQGFLYIFERFATGPGNTSVNIKANNGTLYGQMPIVVLTFSTPLSRPSGTTEQTAFRGGQGFAAEATPTTEIKVPLVASFAYLPKVGSLVAVGCSYLGCGPAQASIVAEDDYGHVYTQDINDTNGIALFHTVLTNLPPAGEVFRVRLNTSTSGCSGVAYQVTSIGIGELEISSLVSVAAAGLDHYVNASPNLTLVSGTINSVPASTWLFGMVVYGPEVNQTGVTWTPLESYNLQQQQTFIQFPSALGNSARIGPGAILTKFATAPGNYDVQAVGTITGPYAESGSIALLAVTFVTLLAVACPIAPLTATVGVFYQSDPPIVVGDILPDTFALLSGPSWMTIDPLTGVVSGTPDAEGTFTYTIQVTDSLDNVAVVAAPCPLTVSNPIPPPPFCILVPATPPQALVLYPEPLEQQGT